MSSRTRCELLLTCSRSCSEVYSSFVSLFPKLRVASGFHFPCFQKSLCRICGARDLGPSWLRLSCIGLIVPRLFQIIEYKIGLVREFKHSMRSWAFPLKTCCRKIRIMLLYKSIRIVVIFSLFSVAVAGHQICFRRESRFLLGFRNLEG